MGNLDNSQNIHCIPPEGGYIEFLDDNHYIEKGTEWGLFTSRSAKKELVYKSGTREIKAIVKGYQEYGVEGQCATVVLELPDGRLTCIHPAYLKEMQSRNFTKQLLSGGEKEPAVQETSPSESAKRKPAASKKEAAKKSTAEEKIILPEEKVHFRAVVQEFTEKMNHFTGEADEVLLLKNTEITGDHSLKVGAAWCGYSKTLKKLGLVAGDLLEFDGKAVEKKFSKEVRFKINNPSRIKVLKQD